MSDNLQPLLDILAELPGCPDCDAGISIVTEHGITHLIVMHDETCPTLKESS